MANLTFHDYLTQFRPQQTDRQNDISKFTQELCEALEKHHLTEFAQDEVRNKSRFYVEEARKYFKIIEINDVSWYEQCLHVFVNKDNGNVHASNSKRKVLFNVLNEEFRTNYLQYASQMNAHCRLSS